MANHQTLTPWINLLSRRDLLRNSYTALASIGLADLLAHDLTADNVESSWMPGQGRGHFSTPAKRVLQIFCPGAASHMDLWEHKPELDKRHGQPLPGEEDLVSFQGKNGNLMKSPWKFMPAGECGKLISSMLPQMAQHVDDIAFV